MSEQHTTENHTVEARNKKIVRRFRLFSGFALLGMAALFAPRVWAHAERGGCRDGEAFNGSAEEMRQASGFFAKRLLKKIDATPEQQVAIEKMLDKWTPQFAQMRQERRRVREELQKVLSADSVDRSQLEKIRQEALTLAEQATGNMANVAMELSEVLTPEQRAKVMKKFMARHHGPKHRR